MQFEIPSEPSLYQAIKDYILLGIKHIWEGIDHLLFVACLVFIAGFSTKLFYAITGFTIAHSITLCLAALNLIRLPIPPIEACIALSIVFLCYEIIHHHQNKSSLTYRYPIAVSSSFGLLHGLGFASVLSDIGLPNTSKIPALLSFNIGVEIGQLFFILGLFLSAFFIKKIPFLNYKKLQIPALQFGIYTIGIIAAYWFFDRIFV